MRYVEKQRAVFERAYVGTSGERRQRRYIVDGYGTIWMANYVPPLSGSKKPGTWCAPCVLTRCESDGKALAWMAEYRPSARLVGGS
jgi:hypothetical protein